MDFSCQEVMLLLQAQEVTLQLVRDGIENREIFDKILLR